MTMKKKKGCFSNDGQDHTSRNLRHKNMDTKCIQNHLFFTLEWLQIHEIIFEFEYQGRQK